MPRRLSLLGVALLFASAAVAEPPRVVLVPSPLWTAEAKEDVELALGALPPAARRFPGRPLEVELHAERAPLGLGDATHPAFTDGSTRLHLYGYAPSDDARATARLGELTQDERQRLWRRRAVVHAVIRRWDERLKWSDRAGWRRLAGWSGNRPLLVYAWAFSRREGMASPALDLATFAEELLVPPESFDEDAVPLDDRARCREFSKARFLDERLRALDPSWKPSRDCPAFERWADRAHLRGFEVLFSAPSSGSAQAIFGHMLLRIVRDGDDDAPGGGQVMQLAALISPVEPPTSFLLRGLAGGFRGVFALSTVADVRHEALGLEQRSLRRFTLALSAEQRERLLERVWELERVGYLDYRFFDANCSTMLRFLVEPVLDEAAPGAPWTPWETPAQVLDGFAAVLRPSGLDEASGDVAGHSLAAMRRLLADAPPAARQALGPHWATLEALPGARPPERRAAYAALQASLPAALEGWRAQVALASLHRERFELDVATAARIRAEKHSLLPGWKGPTTDELVAARQHRYEQELTPRVRAEAELAELLSLDELLRSAPRRPADAAELAAREAEGVARETFEAAATVVAELPEAELAQARDEERAAQRRFVDETVARAVPEGGLGHGFFAGGALLSGRPLLRVRLAAIAEELGDQRMGGFGSHVAVRALDGTLQLTTTPGQVVDRAGVTVLGVRALSDGRWGWGAAVDYGFAGGAHEVTAVGEGLLALVADERLTNFLLLTAGARAGLHAAGVGQALVAPQVGVSARLQLPGSFGNAVRLDAGWTPRLLAGGGAVVFEHGVTARVSGVVRLGRVGALVLSARAEVEAAWRPGGAPEGLALLGVEVD